MDELTVYVKAYWLTRRNAVDTRSPNQSGPMIVFDPMVPANVRNWQSGPLTARRDALHSYLELLAAPLG